MKILKYLFIFTLLISCQKKNSNSEEGKKSIYELKTLSKDGINITFSFNNEIITFQDLHSINTKNNTEFINENPKYKDLNDLNISFIDGAYFGIKNENEIGDKVTLWLFPHKNKKYNTNESNINSIDLNYIVLNNKANSVDTVEKVFLAFKNNFNVSIKFEGEEIDDFQKIKKRINSLIDVSRNELKVEPGTNEAIKLI